MRIHTLGPKQTDSYAATKYYVNQHLMNQGVEIELHTSFEKIIAQMSKYQGEYIVIPAAFKSKELGVDWGDFHYRNIERLKLITSFIFEISPLVLLKNSRCNSGIAYTHAALADLLRQVVEPAEIRCAKSKYLAYQEYLEDGQYVLTNTKNIHLRENEIILKKFSPQMVWVVYQIIKE
ncbi:hypothetical protein QS460_06650 [Liquorilactobacillus mali]|uniref:hypothetical protein n=1 Tax=Liquorilactobacillus mali TaxID=1618 RepID=UPI0026566C47|nr:hypothetical protein [Liquorilactobacillus mali]MDN7145606.1 hypothetical protein [Liquorilactobacillus mali]